MLNVPQKSCVGSLGPAIDYVVVGETGNFKVGHSEKSFRCLDLYLDEIVGHCSLLPLLCSSPFPSFLSISLSHSIAISFYLLLTNFLTLHRPKGNQATVITYEYPPNSALKQLFSIYKLIISF